MKTCSFRDAKPRSTNEGLFCREEPDARYSLLPCNNCPLCVPPRNVVPRYQPPMRFGPSARHRFINGYQSILNGPADCETRNIIYVMTCPCDQYEYIGETGQRIGDRLTCKWKMHPLSYRFALPLDHRQHWNRIIHEFLIGEQNAQLNRTQAKDHESVNTFYHRMSCVFVLGRWSKIGCCCIDMPLDVRAPSRSSWISIQVTDASFRSPMPKLHERIETSYHQPR
jgi:hypothetical protein